MKITGRFKIEILNKKTGDITSIEGDNIVTNSFYRDIMCDSSTSSIGLYLWTSPYNIATSRRRSSTSASTNFFNNGYGYIPQGDWFARYIEKTETTPGYYEVRTRIDPPATGETRTIRTLMLTNYQPRTDDSTGLLPDNPQNIVKSIDDIRANPSNSSATKANIHAYIVLDEDCIQSDSEVFDVYYRIIFDNQYVNCNLNDEAIEIIGKLFTAKMPTVNSTGTSSIFTLSHRAEQRSKNNDVNFRTIPLLPTSFSPLVGDSLYDYINGHESIFVTNKYVSSYISRMGKDSSVGKVISDVLINGTKMVQLATGYSALESQTTIGNTHSHSPFAIYPFFDPSRLASGIGTCTMSSSFKPKVPEFIRINIVNGGTRDSTTYNYEKYPYTGVYKNTFEPLILDYPETSSLVINNGTYRNGKYTQSRGRAYGTMYSSHYTHPSLTGITYNSSTNPRNINSRMMVEYTSGIVDFDGHNFLAYSKEGVTLFGLDGEVKTLSFSSPPINITNLRQVHVDSSTFNIYVCCADNGLFRVDSNLSSVIKMNNPADISDNSAYGFYSSGQLAISIFGSNISYSLDGMVTWTNVPHIDYSLYGLQKEKIFGIKGHLHDSSFRSIINFDTRDNNIESPQKTFVFCWFDGTTLLPSSKAISTNNYGITPSFLGSDYIDVKDDKFYYLATMIGSSTDNVLYELNYGTVNTTERIRYESDLLGMPLIKNGKFYAMGTSTVYVSDGSTTTSYSDYGTTQKVYQAGMSDVTPFSFLFKNSGLVIVNGYSVFNKDINNNVTNGNNIRNYSIGETANIICSKIINPFFNKSEYEDFVLRFGWNGSNFDLTSNTPKTVNAGANSMDNFIVDFNGLGEANDFVTGDWYSAIRVNGLSKDNSTSAKISYSTSYFNQSETRVITGIVSDTSVRYKIGKFEREETSCEYRTSDILLGQETTPIDYVSTDKIPQESGLIEYTVSDSFCNFRLGITNRDGTDPMVSIFDYKKSNGLRYIRTNTLKFSYEKNADISPLAGGGTEVQVVSGDVIRIEWQPGTNRKSFSIKKNGTVLLSGINGNSNVNNSALLRAYLTVSPNATGLVTPTSFTVPYLFTSQVASYSMVGIPLPDYLLDQDGVSANIENEIDTYVLVDGVRYEHGNIEYQPNNTIPDTNRRIPSFSYSGDSISGIVLLPIQTIGKPYTIEYRYYKD